MQPPFAVLALADSFEDVWPQLAASTGARVRVVSSLEELAPVGEPFAIVLSLAGREETAPERLAELMAVGGVPVAVVGSASDHRMAVAALRAGGAEYFALPADLEALRSWLADGVASVLASQRARALAEREREEYDFTRLLGKSADLRRALDVAARIIPRGAATVLITGETGTGKELLAQAIHYNGPRAPEPFVEVNCSALPPNLLEAELFGYERGAFTDARVAKPGLFEAAHKGTLFLDEIGELSVELQAKLLRALEEKRVRRLGALRSVDVDVRIIAATHVDLGAAIREGSFREDLYYRLGVVPIHLPPLRSRGEDVLLLAEHFLDHFVRAYELPRSRLEQPVRRALLAHSWPGNVRELRNAVERAVLLGGGEVRVDDLFLSPGPSGTGTGGGDLPFPASLPAIERAAARLMVERQGGNKSAAADALGISRSRLYRLLEDAVEPEV